MITGSFDKKSPKIHESAYIAKGAVVIGDVEIGENASFWFYAVARGDQAPVKVGSGTNIQDSTVLHVSDGSPCTIGNNVTVGHRVVIHGATIGDNCVIGMGAVVLDGAELGEGCVVAAGSVVPPRKKFPPRSFIIGTPGRPTREVGEQEYNLNQLISAAYVDRAQDYKKEGY